MRVGLTGLGWLVKISGMLKMIRKTGWAGRARIGGVSGKLGLPDRS